MSSSLGQYFTTNKELQRVIYKFILNEPSVILEPCIGRGDLIHYILKKKPTQNFDMYEIDPDIKLLNLINRKLVVYEDFLDINITKSYDTIIGNPPYIKTDSGNLYLKFIKKCIKLLNPNGELIFIVPSDFFKLTSAARLLHKMMNCGSFTHIYHPHDEKLFENASIDVLVFRYCKNKLLDKVVLYNEEKLYITNNNGLITFNKTNNISQLFKEHFDIFVGIVSGRDSVFKHNKFGNISVLIAKNKYANFIHIKTFPSNNEKINKYLLKHKDDLLARRIRSFDEKNWFEWGRMRDLEDHLNKDCIYIHTITRKSEIAFIGKVNYFSGNLLMLLPRDKNHNLQKVVNYLNSSEFKINYTFSGRFKIGHRQISNSYLP